MGVRGLTSYIAKNADKYLEPYELHDCNLVIDGDSIGLNLYRWNSQCNSAFGGDYDEYYRIVIKFFETLKKCNVTSYVLLDGGYHRKKLQTVRSRLRSKITALKHVNPFNCLTLFPLHIREVFVAAVKESGIPVMRCILEADDEVAILARKLNCPVMSYDSDFYIHNVQYIPMVTLTMKLHRKKMPRKQSKRETFVPYYFLDCSIYKMENLAKGRIDDNMLPLFATLLGNDYINRSIFHKFYANFSLKGCGKRNTRQERRIIGLLRWLQNENLDSAIKKILNRVERERKAFVASQIEGAMSGYIREKSEAFEYFCINHVNDQKNLSTETSDELMNFTNKPISIVESENEELCESCDNSIYEESESETESETETETDDGNCKENSSISSVKSQRNNEIESKSKKEIKQDLYECYEPPDWLVGKIKNCEFPRFIVDLLCLKLYVNSPQIENFMLPDSNTIALPILQYIFTLLWYPQSTYFQYLTRVIRVSDVNYKHFRCLDIDIQFDPASTDNAYLFQYIFKDFSCKEEMFIQVATLPKDIQLYFLAIFYWSKMSKNVSKINIHCLLICYCILSEADQRIGFVTRNLNDFTKKYKFFLNNSVEKIDLNNDTSITDDSNIESFINQLSMNESIQLEYNLLPFFQISNKLREKHTEFSSTIIHAFAEFQAIVLNMNCLNAVLNNPFNTIKIAKIFNGTLLYNLYNILKDRPSISHYVQYHLFRRCSQYFQFYQKCVSILATFVPLLSDTSQLSKKQLRKRKKQQRRKRNVTQNVVEQFGSDVKVIQSDSYSEFEDVNNKFTTLLKA